MKVPFKTSYVDGFENVMVVDKKPTKISFNFKTREIFLIYEDDKYTLEDLDGLSWQHLKKLVLQNKGEWTSKKDAFDFLIGREK